MNGFYGFVLGVGCVKRSHGTFHFHALDRADSNVSILGFRLGVNAGFGMDLREVVLVGGI